MLPADMTARNLAVTVQTIAGEIGALHIPHETAARLAQMLSIAKHDLIELERCLKPACSSARPSPSAAAGNVLQFRRRG